MDDQQTREQLNRRYWESDASVSEIADELDISRRALYDGIAPLPAGVPCPACGGMLGFRNRTAAENQEVECAQCGREMTLENARGTTTGKTDATTGTDAQAGRRRTPPPPELEQERSAADLSPVRRVPAAGSGMAIGSVILLGVGVGALAVYLLWQRE